MSGWGTPLLLIVFAGGAVATWLAGTVLSKTTEAYDRGEKFDHYCRIPSLKAVVYVWQDRKQIEVADLEKKLVVSKWPVTSALR